MTNQELLLEISKMLDPIRSDIAEIKQDIRELKDRVTKVEQDIRELKGRVTKVEQDIRELREDMTEVRQDMTKMRQDIGNLQNSVKKLELTQENQILPRLNTIEACYTSTFDRYKVSVEDYEAMKQDVSILKKVVTEHSGKLQKLA